MRLSNFTPGLDYSDPLAWTPKQLKEAKLEAALRKEEKPVIVEVDDKIEMTKTGKVTISYSPRVKFPAYMLASNNNHDSDRKDRKLADNLSLLIKNDDYGNLYGSLTVYNIMYVGVFGYR